MKCQQAGCVRRADVVVANHGLGQVIAFCREHAQWKMAEWQNAGYVLFWQTHLGEIEAAAARRTPTAMAQAEIEPKDGLPEMSAEEAAGEADVIIPVGPRSEDAQRDEAIGMLYEMHRKNAVILEGMHGRLELLHQRVDELSCSGLTEYATMGHDAKESPPDAEPEPPPPDVISRTRTMMEGLHSSPTAAWDMLSTPASMASLQEQHAPDGPVLQFSDNHCYHQLQASFGNEDGSRTYIAGCGTKSEGWAPKDAPSEGSKPCRKCWPREG